MDHPVLTTSVDLVCHTLLDVLTQLALVTINDQLPCDFIATLNNKEKLDAIRACLVVSLLTNGHIVPCVFQLQASLAMLRRQDSVILASTGSSKTLCMLIPILLHLESITITISLLKCLQMTQVRSELAVPCEINGTI